MLFKKTPNCVVTLLSVYQGKRMNLETLIELKRAQVAFHKEWNQISCWILSNSWVEFQIIVSCQASIASAMCNVILAPWHLSAQLPVPPASSLQTLHLAGEAGDEVHPVQWCVRYQVPEYDHNLKLCQYDGQWSIRCADAASLPSCMTARLFESRHQCLDRRLL